MDLQAAVPPPAKIMSTSCRSDILKAVNQMSRQRVMSGQGGMSGFKKT